MTRAIQPLSSDNRFVSSCGASIKWYPTLPLPSYHSPRFPMYPSTAQFQINSFPVHRFTILWIPVLFVKSLHSRSCRVWWCKVIIGVRRRRARKYLWSVIHQYLRFFECMKYTVTNEQARTKHYQTIQNNIIWGKILVKINK